MAGLGRVGRAIVCALIAGAVSASTGCGIRLETPPSPLPSPDAVTAARDALAVAEAAVVDAALLDADPSIPGADAVARAHLDALGGVYVAFPSAEPSASPSPSPGVTPEPPPTLDEAIAAVRTLASDVAASSEDPDLASLATAIDLEWALRVAWAERASAGAAEAPGTATQSPAPTVGPPVPPDAGPTPFPRADGTEDADAGYLPREGTAVPQEVLTALALAHDEARFAYETLAAQEFGPRRDDALARARLHDERSDALAMGLSSDPRTPLYQLRDADLLNPESRRLLERTIELDLATRYAALLDAATQADKAWLLNATFDAYARAMATDGFTVADIPSLPGLRVIGADGSPADAGTASPAPSASPGASQSASPSASPTVG